MFAPRGGVFMIATLFYEEDIVNSGGSVNLRRKVKSGIFSDSYEADIVMSGTKIPAIIKLYHNGSGRIVELLKYESKDNEIMQLIVESMKEKIQETGI